MSFPSSSFRGFVVTMVADFWAVVENDLIEDLSCSRRPVTLCDPVSGALAPLRPVQESFGMRVVVQMRQTPDLLLAPSVLLVRTRAPDADNPHRVTMVGEI